MVFNSAQGGLLKWLTQKETEGRMFNDVRVYFDRYVADLQGQVLGAPNRPIGSAVRSLHLDKPVVVDVDSEGLHHVMPDDNDL